MQADRHEVVHDVVFAGDGGEHARDLLGLFALVYRLESEVCLAHGEAP